MHYGQHTPIPDGPAANGLVKEGWRTLYVTQRFDSIFCFVCQKQ